MSLNRYEMGADGTAKRYLNVQEHQFGEALPVKMPAGPRKDRKLRLQVADDGSVVWLDSRYDDTIQMSREEALELQRLLNKIFPLDALGGI